MRLKLTLVFLLISLNVLCFADSYYSPGGTSSAPLSTGNLTETISSVLTITGGSGAVIGSGTTIQVKQANASTNGYLSSTDWNTFNAKMASPMTTLGDMLYGGASGAATRLAGNITTTRQFFGQTGTGSASAAPAWTALAATDIPSLDASKITTGTLGDARLSSNIPLLSASNSFTGATQTAPTINATTALQLNGVNINTTGIMTNVAYKAQNNNFSVDQVINGSTIGVSGVNIPTGQTYKINGTALTYTDVNAISKQASATTIGYVPTWSVTTGNALGVGLGVGTLANNLVQLNSSSQLPAVSGANLTSLNATNITSGVLGSGYGGAGAINGILKGNGSGTVSTAVAGTDYLAPVMTTLGDMLYGGASGAATRLAGNITTTRQFFGQTGTGSASAAPAWTALAATDIPSLDASKITTGTLPVSRGGTGATTLTGVLKGNGTGAFTAMNGTANYAARWTDANTIGIGALYDNGTNVGVGTNNPSQKLDVFGNTNVSGSITAGTNISAGSSITAGLQLATGLSASATGYCAVALGRSCTSSGDFSFSTGFSNVSSGQYGITMGRGNTSSARGGCSIGYSNNVSQEFSTAIGNENIVSGYYAIAMGNLARATGNQSVAINLDYNNAGPNVPAFNFRITGATAIGGNLAWTNYSDKRLKKDIVEIAKEDNLSKILALKGVRFKWQKDKGPKDVNNLGFIAQDVESIIPESVRYDKLNDIYSMEYNAIIPVLVEAIKEQQKQIEALQVKFKSL